MRDSTLKVAIIRLSSLGDIIVALVFLDLLKGKFARRKIEISWIVDSQFRGILENSPLVDKIIDLPLRQSKKNKRLIFSAIKKVRSLGHFDKVIDSQGLLKSALIGKMLKKSEFIGYDKDSIREKIASFFYTKKTRIAYNEHILKRQYELFKVAFDEVDWESDFRLEMLDSRNRTIDSSKRAKVKIAEILTQCDRNVNKSAKNPKTAPKILFLCETSKADKEFALDSFYALAEGLWSEYKNARIFLIWDKKESEIRALGAKDSRFCVLPHLNFDEIKALLGSVDLVIGGDTGITHSAWAMRVPSVTLYISTNIKRFALCGENHFSISVGKNSSLGAPCVDFGNLGRFADAKVQSHAPNSQKTPQLPPQILELDSSESNESSLRGRIADSHKAIQKNNITESRPIRGAKNRNQGRSSASADFLLESDKRGSPPKSEKAAAFWRVGGAGRGVQPFLRKETNDSISKKIVGDSRIAKIDCFGQSPRNDDIFLDSSLRTSCYAQNDESFVDCHESLRDSRNDGMGVDCFGDESPRNDKIKHDSMQGTDSRNDESIALSTRTAQITQIIKFAKKVLQ